MFSACQCWCPCPLWAAPVDALQKHRHLRRCQRHCAGRGHRPDETPPVHPLRKQAESLTVEPQQFDQVAALATEREQRTGMWFLPEHLLHQYRQAIEALAHVGDAARQEYPRRCRLRDHRFSTPITRDSASASTVPSTVSRTPEGSSMPICPAV